MWTPPMLSHAVHGLWTPLMLSHAVHGLSALQQVHQVPACQPSTTTVCGVKALKVGYLSNDSIQAQSITLSSQ